MGKLIAGFSPDRITLNGRLVPENLVHLGGFIGVCILCTDEDHPASELYTRQFHVGLMQAVDASEPFVSEPRSSLVSAVGIFLLNA